MKIYNIDVVEWFNLHHMGEVARDFRLNLRMDVLDIGLLRLYLIRNYEIEYAISLFDKILRDIRILD